MLVYVTKKGEKTWHKVEERGRIWAREALCLTNFELDRLKMLHDCRVLELKKKGVVKEIVRAYGELEGLGYCEIMRE